MKKENFLDLNLTLLEEKLKENKLKLLNLRGDKENRKLKNVKEVTHYRREVARILTTMGMKKKEALLSTKVTEGSKK